LSYLLGFRTLIQSVYLSERIDRMRSRLAIALISAVGAAMLMSGCSFTISSNDEPTVEVTGSAAASLIASEAAAIDEEIYKFCTNDAEGSIDFISILGDDAPQAIEDGITQSIEQQQMTDAQAIACRQAWADTLAASGIDFEVAGTSTGAIAPTPSPSAT